MAEVLKDAFDSGPVIGGGAADVAGDGVDSICDVGAGGASQVCELTYGGAVVV